MGGGGGALGNKQHQHDKLFGRQRVKGLVGGWGGGGGKERGRGMGLYRSRGPGAVSSLAKPSSSNRIRERNVKKRADFNRTNTKPAADVEG